MKKLLFFLLFSPFIALFSQVENVVIQWSTQDNQHFFPHALYADGENTLPYISRKLSWSAEGMLPRVRLEVTESTYIEDPASYGSNFELIRSEPLIEYSLVNEARQSFVVIKVLPFQQSEAGQLERINSFRIILEEEPAMAKLKANTTGDWSDQSVLASGNWFKIAIEQSGMHKLTYEQLQEIGLANPASVRVYGSGARLLPERFSEGYTDDLNAVPLHIYKGSDGLFGPGDHILFYAQGPVAWSFDQESKTFVHNLHAYSWEGYYFITDSQGTAQAPEEAELSTEAASQMVNSYDYRTFVEDETYNLISSGREWFGDYFSVNLEENYLMVVPGRVEGEPVKIRVRAAARSGSASTFTVRANNDPVGSLSIRATDLSYYTSTYAYETEEIYSYVPQTDNLAITMVYNRPESNSSGWLNYITLNGRSELTLLEDQLPFRDSRSVVMGTTSEFKVGSMDNSALIWDVTDPDRPQHINFTLSGSTASFKVETSQQREFIAFDPSGEFPTPQFSGEGLGAIPNQNLHGLPHPDMVILTPEIFLEQAQRLAEHRSVNDGMEVAVVLQQQVFNEFSSGVPDVTAIRNFMKMFYDRSSGESTYCKYLLFLGDGSFDNRGSAGKVNNPNLLLTYQSEESLSPTRSYVSDDFFGILDTDESMYDGLLDIGMGRLPVSTVEEASDLVDKIIGYSSLDKQGEWRNQICFVGDDEDSNIHMRQADELATYVNKNYPAYNINKIYLDAYNQEDLSTGPRYPDVTRAINDQVNRGALIVNYTGHGGPTGLAHEKITTTNDILSWSNKNMLPLFMTATCEFSRYDEYDRPEDQEVTSAGEDVLLNTEGGGIGLFTTTRLVYSGPNHALNERFYEVVFEKDENQQNYRLGDIILYSKNNTGPGINKRNFTLLGDPSMRLVYPQHRVVTDSINGMSVQGDIDTLSAFQWVSVSGHLETRDGDLMTDFNGTVYPLVFDKEKKIETLSNDDSPVYRFQSRNNILYSGKATVTGGEFSFGFFVPKDINYSFGSGKISYYSNNGQRDAHGSYEGFNVGGIGTENASDSEPPVIELFMNDSFFVSGGITDANPALLVNVTDNFGINTTGNGIGHNLTATLNDDRVNSIILNEFYQARTNSYNSGTIRYPYSNLEPGKHEVTVKIWDIHNNSAQSTLEFVVMESEEMLLENLFNYPNPFVDETWFNVEHNRPDREMRLVITIVNLSGEIVRKIDEQIYSPGYRLEPVHWDATLSGGAKMGAGVYVYTVSLTTEDGEIASDGGKLVITR